MKKLSKKQILMLHTQLIQQTGGSDGVRDYNLLDSALENPFQSFGGEELYPTIQAKAARLGYNIKRSSRLEKDEKYIMVQTAGSHIKIFLRDIVYAEVYNRKVIIHTRSTDIEYYGKLQELSDMAGTDFFRTHRAYLVHFKYVEKYDANMKVNR